MQIMKSFVWLLIPLFLFSCSIEEKKEIDFFKLSTENLIFSWESSALEVSVDANIEWEIVSEFPTWLSVGNVSSQSVTFMVTSNMDETPRLCQVVFSAGTEKYILLVQQNAKERLAFRGEKELYLEAEQSNFLLEIDQNIPFYISFLEEGKEWISYSPLGNHSFMEGVGMLGPISSNALSFSVKENLTGHCRRSGIVIYNNSYQLSDTLLIYQSIGNGKKYVDGECYQLLQASKGSVNLVLMGDGFTAKDLKTEGLYEQSVYRAMKYFFSIEPYYTYQDYFNVYMVIAESKDEGVGEKNTINISSFQNKFDSAFGSGTEITCNTDLVLEYARKVKELPADQPITAIVVLNSTKYAGTTYLYGNGNSIALCPMSAEESPNDFEGLIHHEAGGHGFGFLCDEYVYYEKEMPDSRKEDLREWQKQGFQMNLDFTDDLSEILWKDFIGIGKYADVGAYEGGYEYRYGVWRSEQNSCMNNNIPYFNVQSRWSIVRRIMQLSGCDFSIQDFIENDYPVYPSETRTWSKTDFVPLGSPIWIR